MERCWDTLANSSELAAQEKQEAQTYFFRSDVWLSAGTPSSLCNVGACHGFLECPDGVGRLAPRVGLRSRSEPTTHREHNWKRNLLDKRFWRCHNSLEKR